MRDLWNTLDGGDVLALVLLAVVVLQHAGTAGIRACMGRDGRVHHRGIEVTGAMRGVVALAALMTPVAIVWALDALSSPARFELYLRANVAMLWLWIPLTLAALLSFLVARLSPWQVRSSLNSMVFSVLELLRPLVASAGIVIAAFATSDIRVALVGSFAVFMAMQTSRVTRRWWYSKPVTLDALGASGARGKITS
jgi:hypothetical protein